MEIPRIRSGQAPMNKKTYQYALYLQTRREYSAHELLTKMLEKGHEPDDAQAVLASLQADNLQSDARYVDNLIRYRSKQGKGPIRILRECHEKRVDTSLVEQQLRTCDIDWVSLAQEVRRKRFGEPLPETVQARQQQQQFLRYRGFEGEHIRLAFSAQDAI